MGAIELKFKIQPVSYTSLAGKVAIVGSVEECTAKNITDRYEPTVFYGIGIQTARMLPDPVVAKGFKEKLHKKARYGDFATRCETVDFDMAEPWETINGNFEKWLVANTEGYDVVILENRPLVAIPPGQTLEQFVHEGFEWQDGEMKRGFKADVLPSYTKAVLKMYLESFKQGEIFSIVPYLDRGEGIKDTQLRAGIEYATSLSKKIDIAIAEGDMKEAEKNSEELRAAISAMKGLI